MQEQGIAGPDFAGDAQKAAAAMMTKHPDLDGIWAVWDVPAEGVMAALRAAGNQHITVTTEDLGLNVAVAMAKDQFVKGLGAQRPFDQGVTEAQLAAYGLLHRKAPLVRRPARACPWITATSCTAWQTVYHASPPQSLASAFHS